MTRRITISPRHPSKGNRIERGRGAREEFIPPPLRVTVTRVGCVAVKVIARYAELVDAAPEMADLGMYATHYSTAGIVLHYLVRRVERTTVLLAPVAEWAAALRFQWAANVVLLLSPLCLPAGIAVFTAVGRCSSGSPMPVPVGGVM